MLQILSCDYHYLSKFTGGCIPCDLTYPPISCEPVIQWGKDGKFELCIYMFSTPSSFMSFVDRGPDLCSAAWACLCCHGLLLTMHVGCT